MKKLSWGDRLEKWFVWALAGVTLPILPLLLIWLVLGCLGVPGIFDGRHQIFDRFLLVVVVSIVVGEIAYMNGYNEAYEQGRNAKYLRSHGKYFRLQEGYDAETEMNYLCLPDNEHLELVEKKEPPRDQGGGVVVDELLWSQCQTVIPQQMPAKLPALLGTVDGNVQIIMVDGDLIKIHHDMNFVEGGHGIKDPGLCGKNQAFLDDNIALHEMAFIAYRLIVERREMIEGMSYARAHSRANACEKQLRIRIRSVARMANSQGTNAPASPPSNPGV